MVVGRSGVVVIGGANVDIKARSLDAAIMHTSNPGQSATAPGGVGRNVAENIARLGDRVELVSVVGRDGIGDELLEHTATAGVGIDYVARTDLPTGTYTAVLDADGELLIAIADMGALAELGADQLNHAGDAISAADIVVVDGNLELAALNRALDLAAGVRTIFEPVSVPKARKLRDAIDGRVYAVTPNRDELEALTGLPTSTDDELNAAATTLHDQGVDLVWVRLGERGSRLSSAAGVVDIAAPQPATIHDVTGAGDAMLGAFCHALLAGDSPELAAQLGHVAAALTIASPHTVRPDLTAHLVRSALDPETL